MIKVNGLESFKRLINENDVVLVDFTSKYCGPCRLQERELKILEQHFGNKILIISVDINENLNLATKYGINATPTLMFFKKGKKVRFKSRTKGRIDRFIGLQNANRLIGPINYLLNLKK